MEYKKAGIFKCIEHNASIQLNCSYGKLVWHLDPEIMYLHRAKYGNHSLST